MSLAAKFENITEAEVPAIVAAVKADGLKKSGLADNWEVLQARCGSDDEAQAVGAAKAVVALMTECPTSQIFVKECLGACKLIYGTLVADLFCCNYDCPGGRCTSKYGFECWKCMGKERNIWLLEAVL